MTASMDHRPLGRSGLVVSRVGLGCNNFGRRIGPDAARAVIDAAVDAGVTLLDTSDSSATPTRSSASRSTAAATRS
jgi:aryl-alcohol dehydrogenase-like predicted oxidoreductase